MPAVSSLFEQPLTIVDIETTGSRVVYDRIIEIGILRVEKGKITKKFQSLINPQMYISPFISQLTGISQNQLQNAPTFEDIKEDIFCYFEDSFFVAHNVRFDYGFIKNEFKRFGITFSSKNFCSARLSRLLFPQHQHHNLDSIIERFGLDCQNRHRAYDDAKAVYDFFRIVEKTVEPETVTHALQQLFVRPSVPTAITSQIDILPESPGVYMFYDAEKMPLYIGKSTNIKGRVISHFTNDYTSSKEMNLCQQVVSIDFQKTHGELGALFLESSMIKTEQPLFNRVLRRTHKLILLRLVKTEKGYYSVDLETVDTISPEDTESILGIFKSVKQAKGFLDTVCKDYHLCGKLLRLEKTKGECFLHKLEICQGACIEAESVDEYNTRCLLGFDATRIQPWPFRGPVAIMEQDSDSGEAFVVDRWCLVGTIKFDSYNEGTFKRMEYVFDYDIYKILGRYLRNKSNYSHIRHLQSHEMHNLMQNSAVG